jgi:peptide/nickel transport system substrate-binding protein
MVPPTNRGTLKKPYSPARLRSAVLRQLLRPVLALVLLVVFTYPSQSAVRTADRSTLFLGWALEPRTLDPVNRPQNPDFWAMALIYDQLVRVGSNGTSLLPDLATSWTITRRGTVYTFHLRKSVQFQDGEKLTAGDIAFCLNRARESHQLWSWTLAKVRRIQVVSTSTLRIELKESWAPFLSDLALGDTGVYPEAYFRRHGASYLSSHPVGTGPYQLESWHPGTSLRLVKSSRSWMARSFPLRHLELDLIPNDAARLMDVQYGELDADLAMPPYQAANVQHQRGVKVMVTPSTATTYLLLNNRTPPLNDVQVRQAISRAIDRSALVNAVLAGNGRPANSFLPVGATGYNGGLSPPTQDPALAAELLRHSSVPHGFTMEMEIGSGDITASAIASVIRDDLRPLGIKLETKQLDADTLFKDLEAGKYQATTSGWSNDISDPDELVSFGVDYTQSARSFYTWYDNPTLTRLSRQAEHTTNSATRRRLYDQIQQTWAHDQPFLALYYQPFVIAISPAVHRFSVNPLGYFELQNVTK